MNKEGIYHVPVLLHEVMEALQVQPAGIYVDTTFGGGGHSRKILEALGAEGRLIAFDQDREAGQNVPDDQRILFLPQNFRHLQKFLRYHHIEKVDGILADLGVSSHQFNAAERGFSTRFDARLDMRMNQKGDATAAKILNEFPEKKLHLLFEQYGEVTNARSLAKKIVELRTETPFSTIKAFQAALYPLVKGNPQKYFAQVFQALRIEVNGELDALKELLAQAPKVMKPGGRLAIITFHSLEDRIVKNFFKYENFEGEVEKDFYGRPSEKELRILTKKPVLPSEGEIKNNSRARSAKLRVAEKI